MQDAHRSSGKPVLAVTPAQALHARGTSACLAVLVAVTMVAFEPVRFNGLVWDDVALLVQNEHYQGLSLEHLRWMFTTGFGGHYQPLAWLSFAIDWQLWGGLSPFGVHVTNLLLHVVGVCLFFFVSRRLLALAQPAWPTGVVTVGALAAALLFAVHPLRVESVAWATERRDVLSGALLLATVWLYLRSQERRKPAGASTKPGRLPLLTAAWLCFVLSLLAKAWGITLPVVLLVLDAYPLRRLRNGGWRAALIEKLAFALPAVGAAVLAGWAQAQSGAMRSLAEHPLSLRLAQAAYGLVFYVYKTVWPAALSPLYEQDPADVWWSTRYLLAAAVVLVATVALVAVRRRHPAWSTAGAVYAIVLLPVLGLTQSGQQVVAERYSYLACLPWAALAGAGVARLAIALRSRPRPTQRAWALLGAAVVVVLVVATRAQVLVWRNAETLWSHTLAVRPGTPTAHASLAEVLLARGEYDDARRHAEAALQVLPGNRGAHRALAQSALGQGDLATAELHFREALRIAEVVGRPDPASLTGLAQVYAQTGRFAEAADVYQQATEIEPALIEAYYWWGRAAYAGGDRPAAIAAWDAGLVREPRHVRLRAWLAWVLATAPEAALRDGPRALTLAQGAWADSKERSPRAGSALAAALAELGRFPEALLLVESMLGDASLASAPAFRTELNAAAAAYRASTPWRANGP